MAHSSILKYKTFTSQPREAVSMNTTAQNPFEFLTKVNIVKTVDLY